MKSKNIFECESCEKIIYSGPSYILEYLQGAMHRYLMHVFYLSDCFKEFSIYWGIESFSQYYCGIHKEVLPVESTILLNHIKKYHKCKESMEINDSNSISILALLENVLNVLKNKIWLIDFLSKNESLNEYFRIYGLLSRPIRIVEDNPIFNFIFDLRNDIFCNEDLTIITKVAS